MILKLYSSILQTLIKFLLLGLGLQKQTDQADTPAFKELMQQGRGGTISRQSTQGMIPDRKKTARDGHRISAMATRVGTASLP